MSRPLVVGLTGGIASGKSTVEALFAALGVPVLDADAVTRTLVEPGQPALAEIVAAFGAQILNPDGTLDRAGLRGRVFGDPAARRKLEAILHPRVREAMRAWVAARSAPYCVLSIPLLVESGQRDLVDRVLVVDVPERLQIARARARDGSPEHTIRGILQAQVSRSERLAAADDVLDNSAAPDRLQARVQLLHERYTALAAGICHGTGK